MDSNQPEPTTFSSDEQIELRSLVDIALGGRWLILGCTAIGLLLGIFFAWTASPIFRSTALLQVQRQDNGLMAGGLEAYFSAQAMGPAAIQILTSRSVVSEAVEKLNLGFSARPTRFPFIGAAIADDNSQAQAPVSAPLGLQSYGWGGEHVVVTRLQIPQAWLGRRLLLVAGQGDRYRLLGAAGNVLLQGRVGELAQIELTPTQSQGRRGQAAELAILVETLEARPGTVFILRKVAEKFAVANVRSRLTAEETSPGSGMLRVALEGADPAEAAATLDAIANSYLRQNVERHTEEAARRLAFLKTQLPRLKEELKAAETALREFRSKTGTVNLSAEGSAILEQATEIEQRISELQLQRAELERLYTPEHPAMAAYRQKLAQLRETKAQVQEQLKKLPETEFRAVQLRRDVEVATELYLSLLNKAQELRIAKAGKIGNVRIIDSAYVPEAPIRPKPTLMALMALIAGLIIGLALTFARHTLKRALENPDAIEQRFGLPVYAVIPNSRYQGKLNFNKGRKERSGEGNKLLAMRRPEDNAVESLRSLRTSLQFALMDADNNIVSIGGPTQGLGKSFVAANLAATLADAEQKVVLIDGDMRRGSLHRYAGLKSAPGLADVISGRATLDEALVPFYLEGRCMLLPCGTIPPNPSELLSHPRFGETLSKLSSNFDLVLVDAPPTLNLADGILIAKQSGTNFMVVRGGVSTSHDLQICLKRVLQNHIAVAGIVFNDLTVRAAAYGYGSSGYRYYQHSYKPRKA